MALSVAAGASPTLPPGPIGGLTPPGGAGEIEPAILATGPEGRMTTSLMLASGNGAFPAEGGREAFSPVPAGLPPVPG